MNELIVGEETYVPRHSLVGRCVIVSCGSLGGGIHLGTVLQKNDTEVTLTNARRIQYWSGAASITEMAVRGVSNPGECRFSRATPEIVLKWVEIIPVSVEASLALYDVPVWTR